MRQIPRYGIIGNGKLAKHLLYYFSLINSPCHHWRRKTNQPLNVFINNSDIILVLIKDSEIESFIIENLLNSNKILIHCSGSLYTKLAIGMHPLMSFSSQLYDLQTYQNINFIIDHQEFDFNFHFPSLKNKHYFINQDYKAYYHSLCVMSGNFSTILWSKLFEELEKINIPKEAAFSYLDSVNSNLKHDYKNALTGPLIRNDTVTIEKNLHSLENDKYLSIYKAFVALYKTINSTINNE